MYIKEIIRELNWFEIEKCFLNFYPDETLYLDYYKKIFWDLNNLSPIYHEEPVVLEAFPLSSEEDDMYYYDDISPEPIDQEIWQNILGFKVDKKVFRQLEKAEFITHLMFEVSYGNIEFD